MTTILIVGLIVVLIFIVLLLSYVKAPPATAYIISGLSKEPRVLIGKGGFRIPYFERRDTVYLGQITVDIKTETSVPTSDFINVDVDAVAKIRVEPTADGIRLAAKNFLNMVPKEIAEQVQDSLQGNMREIIGTLDLKALNTDRDGFSDEVMKKASPDMAKLGIEIISCNIQNVTDKAGLIYDLGADNTAKIKKSAAINKAIAERDVNIEISKANKEANDARVQAETAIAERNNELELKRAELKKLSDTQKAIADAAYKIQELEQQRTINSKSVEAEIELTNREQELSLSKIKVKENELSANIEKEADAAKYRVTVEASAQLEARKRAAESKRYEAEQEALALKAQSEAAKYQAAQIAEAERYKLEQEAEAQKAKADAAKYQALQEAEGIKAKGLAEAAAIEAAGKAEALAMDRKAEAFKKYNEAAMAEMFINVLPQIAERVAEPMKAISSVNIYGTNGDGVTQMSGNVPVLIKQVFDTVSQATGVDLKDVMRGNTIQAQTDRHIDINGAIPTQEK